MNIIIPLGGIGQRFSTEGYSQPKSLIKVFGRPLIFWVLDHLKVDPEKDQIVIIYHPMLDKYNFTEIISQEFSTRAKIKLFKLSGPTQGASETIMKGLEGLSEEELSRQTMCIDGDTFYTCDIVSKYKDNPGNRVFCFESSSQDPIYSYIKIDSEWTINAIAEKKKISKYANTGCYCFNKGNQLLEYCRKIVNNDIRTSGEFYTSCIINEMLKDGIPFKGICIPESDLRVLGIPSQLRIFCNSHQSYQVPQRFCFDLDSTLVTKPVNNDYSTVLPIERNINFCRFLKDQGHYIIIHTARRMRTHNGNVGAVINDIGKITIETLDNFKIPYDELYFGKPYANFYIDDLAISAHMDLEKELGYYQTRIAERDFHKVEIRDNCVIKSSHSGTLLNGEIYWYNNIPRGLEKYFPKLIQSSHDCTQLTIEKINGITLSNLFVNESMSPILLQKLMSCIKEIHESPIDGIDGINGINGINIYSNYAEKLKKRYQDYDYNNSRFPDSEKVYNYLINALKKYECESRGKLGVIHGDPVFTNVLINQNFDLKLIDMRGRLGDMLTIGGDCMYDYAKIYQSLIGYDLILLNKQIGLSYQMLLLETFESYFTQTQIADIKLITASLLFSLIPLHDNEKCIKYYKLIWDILPL